MTISAIVTANYNAVCLRKRIMTFITQASSRSCARLKNHFPKSNNVDDSEREPSLLGF